MTREILYFQAKNAILRLLASSDAEARATAADILCLYPDLPEWDDLIQRLSLDPDPVARKAAEWAVQQCLVIPLHGDCMGTGA